MNYYLELFLILDQKYQVIIKKVRLIQSLKDLTYTSDGIRTETNKGVVISQSIFDGGSSFSEIQISKNEIFSQRFYLRNIEQEVFLEGIKLYADLLLKVQI